MEMSAGKAESNRERRTWYKEHGICESCGCGWADPGRVLCTDCRRKADARQKRRDPDGEKHKQYVKELRDERRARGLCIDCGAPNDGVHTRCKRCVARLQERVRMYKLRRKIREGRA